MLTHLALTQPNTMTDDEYIRMVQVCWNVIGFCIDPKFVCFGDYSSIVFSKQLHILSKHSMHVINQTLFSKGLTFCRVCAASLDLPCLNQGNSIQFVP